MKTFFTIIVFLFTHNLFLSQSNILVLNKEDCHFSIKEDINFLTPEASSKRKSFSIKSRYDSLFYLMDSINKYDYIVIKNKGKKIFEGELIDGEFNGTVKYYYKDEKLKEINTFQTSFENNNCEFGYGEPRLANIKKYSRNGNLNKEATLYYDKCIKIFPVPSPGTKPIIDSIEIMLRVKEKSSDWTFIYNSNSYLQSFLCYSVIDRKQIKIKLAHPQNYPHYLIDNQSDGVFDTLESYYRFDIRESQSSHSIPDSLVSYFTIDSVIHPFKQDIVTTDSMITIQCNGYKSMTIPLSPIRYKWDNHVIRVWLEPDFSPYESKDEAWDIIFNRKRKSNLLEVNGYLFKIVNLED